jgi:RHS repeat-associated protein
MSSNPVTEVSRDGYVITATFDALNRKTMVVLPASTPRDTTTVEFGYYPRYADNGESRGELVASTNIPLSVPADTQTFTYDVGGNFRTAFNRDAHVSRTYNPNGTVATDTLRIRTYSGVDFLTHVYGLSYIYDLDGRATVLHLPGTLTYVAGDSESFNYDNATGNLNTVTDVRGNWFQYIYDAIDRINTIGYFQHGQTGIPTSTSAESFGYDGDSRQLWHQDFFTQTLGPDTGWTTNQLRADTIAHDGRAKVMNIRIHQGQLVTPELIRNRYDGLGQLAVYKRTLLNTDGTEKDEGPVQDMKYDQADAFGNEASIGECISNGNNINRTYDSLSARITFQRWVDDGNAFTNSVAHEWDFYDQEGSMVFQRRDGGFERGPTNGIEDDESFDIYGADRKVHYTDRRNNWQAYTDSGNVNELTLYKVYFDEFRYDALGRRIMRRSRATSDCDSLNCYSVMQRFVYDGGELLWEISRPGTDTVSAANLEADATQVPVDSRLYGRVLYLNGLIGGRPVDVTRYGFGYPYGGSIGFHVWGPLVIVPHYAWNDQVDWISFESGQQFTCVQPHQVECVVYRLPNTTNAFLHNGTWPTASWLGTTLNGGTENQGSGLQYMGARFYDPVNSTFTQEDPIGIGGGLNAYGFAGGDPVSYGDPHGTCGPICIIGIGALVGAYVNAAYHGYELYRHGAKLSFGNMWGSALTGALHGAQIASAVVGLEGTISDIAAGLAGGGVGAIPQVNTSTVDVPDAPPPVPQLQAPPMENMRIFSTGSDAFNNGKADWVQDFDMNHDPHLAFSLHAVRAVESNGGFIFTTDASAPETNYVGWIAENPAKNGTGTQFFEVAGHITNATNKGIFIGFPTAAPKPPLPIPFAPRSIAF